MASLETINQRLSDAIEQLNLAAHEIRDLPLAPAKENIELIGEAIGAIFQIQYSVFIVRPDLDPELAAEMAPAPHRELTEEESAIAAQLEKAVLKEIDDFLLAQASPHWRKLARLVASVMVDFENLPEGLPDIFYAQRVERLVAAGLLESRGDLRRMGYSEVRLPGTEKK